MKNNPETYIEPAIQWATAQLGCTGYPFKCLSFVEDAYELGNGIVLDGCASAKEEADAFQASQHTGLPPRGAFVFYDCWGTLMGAYRNWGHVGISLGDGTVIHAWDQVRIDGYLDIQALEAAPGWTKPEYVGWAPLETILRGMTVK